MMWDPLEDIWILGRYWGVGVSKEARAVVSIGVWSHAGTDLRWAPHKVGPTPHRCARAEHGRDSRGCLSGCQRRTASPAP
jgi:hypothetical protein